MRDYFMRKYANLYDFYITSKNELAYELNLNEFQIELA